MLNISTKKIRTHSKEENSPRWLSTQKGDALLPALSEEMQMFIEVGRRVSEEIARATQKNERLSSQKKADISGKATEDVIREHLLSKGLNASRTRVRIDPSWQEIDLLILKHGTSPSKTQYYPNEVNIVLEIKNNAVADQTTEIRKNFNKLKQITRDVRFAVIVLSERDNYKYAIKEEKSGYPVFTLISRKVSAGRWMWSESETLAMYNKIMSRGKWTNKKAIEETRKWTELINFLRR